MPTENLLSIVSQGFSCNCLIPKDIFLLSSRLSPVLNVDLLIKDESGRILLSWRDDPYVTGPGWHIPGGIVRLKENFSRSIRDKIINKLRTGISNYTKS